MDFEAYVATRGPSLVRFAAVLTGDPHAAEDLVQTALVKAGDRWRRVSRMEHPDAYVRKIVVRDWLGLRRRRAATEVVTDDLPELPSADLADDVGTRDELRRVLAALAPRQRAVLVLRYYADLDDAAIADLLGCGASTVRSQAARALATVRVRLTEIRSQEV